MARKTKSIASASRAPVKLLAANRSEIAIRIFRAATEMHLRTVAIYAQEDRLAVHRFKADEAYMVGVGKGPVGAYLDIEGIVGMASEHEVDFVHPGYGFLAENPTLAERLAEEDIAFIGPSPKVLRLLGDKLSARDAMVRAGLPVAQGSDKPISDEEEARVMAEGIGYPVMIKAAAGGGGIGMQIVESADDFETASNLAETINAAIRADDTIAPENKQAVLTAVLKNLESVEKGVGRPTEPTDPAMLRNQKTFEGMLQVAPFPAGGELSTPENIMEAARQAMFDGKTGYVPSTGIPQLRDALAEAIGHDAQTVADLAVAVAVPMVAALTAVQSAPLLPLLHEDAVVVVESERRPQELSEIGHEPGVVDEPLEGLAEWEHRPLAADTAIVVVGELGVGDAVQLGHLCRRQHPFDDQVALQIELEFLFQDLDAGLALMCSQHGQVGQGDRSC